ncbi:MAG: alanine racemase [Acidobacteriaceae bacterium]
MTRPAEARSSLIALSEDLSRVREFAPNAEILSVIKADAYGHGLLPAAGVLSRSDGFALLDLNDLPNLRQVSLGPKIVLLQGIFSPDKLLPISENRVAVATHCVEQTDMLESSVLPGKIDVFLKRNAGMNRLGFRPRAMGFTVARLQGSIGFDAVWWVSILHRWFVYARLSIPAMTCLFTPFNSNVRHRGHEADAAYGCLKSAPISQLRKAILHLRCRIVFKEHVHGAILLRTRFKPAQLPRVSLCSPRPRALCGRVARAFGTHRTFAHTGSAARRPGCFGRRPRLISHYSPRCFAPSLAHSKCGCGRRVRRDFPGDHYSCHVPNSAPVLVDDRPIAAPWRVSMDMLCVGPSAFPDAGVDGKVLSAAPRREGREIRRTPQPRTTFRARAEIFRFRPLNMTKSKYENHAMIPFLSDGRDFCGPKS